MVVSVPFLARPCMQANPTVAVPTFPSILHLICILSVCPPRPPPPSPTWWPPPPPPLHFSAARNYYGATGRQTADGRTGAIGERERKRLTKPKPIRRRKRERSGISRFRSLGKGGVLLSEAHPIPSRAQMGPLLLYRPPSLPPFTLWADRSEMAERN